MKEVIEIVDQLLIRYIKELNKGPLLVMKLLIAVFVLPLVNEETDPQTIKWPSNNVADRTKEDASSMISRKLCDSIVHSIAAKFSRNRPKVGAIKKKLATQLLEVKNNITKIKKNLAQTDQINFDYELNNYRRIYLKPFKGYDFSNFM